MYTLGAVLANQGKKLFQELPGGGGVIDSTTRSTAGSTASSTPSSGTSSGTSSSTSSSTSGTSGRGDKDAPLSDKAVDGKGELILLTLKLELANTVNDKGVGLGAELANTTLADVKSV